MTVYTDLLRYRDLFGNLFRRDFQARYKGSALGIVWSLANPLLLMAIYVLVFSLLWRVTDAIPHYPLYLLAGLAPWIFFSTSLGAAARSMLDNANLIRKTRFPRQLVPLSAVATQLVTFAVMLAVLLVLNMALIPEVRDTAWLAIPLAARLRRLRRRARGRGRGGERPLPRRRAPDRLAAPALVLPDADPLQLRADPGLRPALDARLGAALGEPGDAADRGDPRAAVGGDGARGRRRGLPLRRGRRRARARRVGLHACGRPDRRRALSDEFRAPARSRTTTTRPRRQRWERSS